jgi:predicted TIM-barrel fold metal-dependent hydrolase
MPSPVAFKVPPNACDTHVHVVADPDQFPMSPERDYTPPPATAAALNDMLHALGVDRVVIVAPTVYGSDNSATIDAVRQLGQERARGIAWIPKNARPPLLTKLKGAGISGFRLFLDEGGAFDPASAKRLLAEKFDLAGAYGWHIDISTPPDAVAAIETELGASPVPLVLDTFGWAAGGITQPGFDAVLSLMESGHVYVKLSEPYRLSSKGPDYRDIAPVVQALLAANPDRVLWGSGWPHVSGRAPGKTSEDLAPNLSVDSGHLLSLLARWVPDPETRHKILVENPAKLYGFGEAARAGL